MTGREVIYGAQDLHPHLLLGHLQFQYLKATNTTNLVAEVPLAKMLAMAQLMRETNLV